MNRQIPVRPRQWVGAALVLTSIATEAVARLTESSWYPTPLRTMQLGLFVVGAILLAPGYGCRPRWIRRMERRIVEHQDDERL